MKTITIEENAIARNWRTTTFEVAMPHEAWSLLARIPPGKTRRGLDSRGQHLSYVLACYLHEGACLWPEKPVPPNPEASWVKGAVMIDTRLADEIDTLRTFVPALSVDALITAAVLGHEDRLRAEEEEAAEDEAAKPAPEMPGGAAQAVCRDD